MNKRALLKAIKVARANVGAEISGTASKGRIAGALSSEGYAGGYRDALDDVAMFLTNGFAQDRRGYWRERT